MKLDNLPDYAKPYKTKGYDVRVKNGTYILFKISSHREEGKSYPVLEQEYIGIINEDGSLRRKTEKIAQSGIYQEYGLSHFLYYQYARHLKRSLFNISGEYAECIVKLAILYYVFGSLSERVRKYSRQASRLDPVLVEKMKDSQMNKILRLSKKMEEEQILRFGDDLNELESMLRLLVMDKFSQLEPVYSDDILQIMQKHGLKV